MAIKFLNPAEISGSVASQRRKFEEEIQIMRMCEHPNIVGFLGCWIMPVRSCLSNDPDTGADINSLKPPGSKPAKSMSR